MKGISEMKINKEKKQSLKQELREYEKITPMTEEERQRRIERLRRERRRKRRQQAMIMRAAVLGVLILILIGSIALVSAQVRRSKAKKAEEKAKQEIQEGLIKACDVIDLIIEILRGSKNRDQVKKCLVEGITEGIRFRTKASEKAAAKLHFTENQANAILDMRLYKLIGLEIEALEAEHAQTLKNIAAYEDILTNYRSMAKVIMKDLDRLKKEYASERKTSIENAKAAVFEEKKMEEAEVVVLIDRFGYTRSVDLSVYERNKESADAENRFVVHCLNTDKLCIFTDTGRLHLLKVADLPYGRFRDKGTPLDNLCNYSSTEEEILRIEGLNAVKSTNLLFATQQGMIKKVEGTEFDVSKRTIASTKLTDGDKLIAVLLIGEEEQIVLQSTDG